MTERSRLELAPLALDPKTFAIDGTAAVGTLDALDAVAFGLFPIPLKPAQGSASFRLALQGRGAGMRADGHIESDRLEWACWPLPRLVLGTARAKLSLDEQAFAMRDLDGSLFGGRLRLDLEIPMRAPTETSTRVHVEGAQQGLGAWLKEALDVDDIPPSVRLDADVACGPTGPVRGSITLASAVSAIELALCLERDGRLDGTRVSGTLSLADLYELVPHRPLVFAGRGALPLRGELEGTIEAPSLHLSIASGAVVLFVASSEGSAVLELDRVHARVVVDRQRVVWSELSIDAYGGRLSSQGLARLGVDTARPGRPSPEKTVQLQTKVAFEALDLERAPLLRGHRLGAYLAGRASGELALKRGPRGAIVGKARVAVADARYPILARIAPQLARYGLDALPLTGSEPLQLELEIDQRGLAILALSAAVRGARLDVESLDVDDRAAVHGKLAVFLEGAYLRTSPILAIPAALIGDVRVPVHVRGTIGAPQAKVDVAETLEGLLHDMPVRRRRRSEPIDPGAAELDDDVLIRRIARGTPHEARYLDILLDRGLSPDEIATRIEDAR